MPARVGEEASRGNWLTVLVDRRSIGPLKISPDNSGQQMKRVPALHHAFATGTDRRDIDRPVGRLHSWRNRVAQHEPLLSYDIAGRSPTRRR